MQKKTEDLWRKFEIRVVEELYKWKFINSPNISYEALRVDPSVKSELLWIDNDLVESLLIKYINEIKDFNKLYFRQKEEALKRQWETENIDINELIRKINQNYLNS